MDGLFAGTAEYYARYRPRYPQELFDHLLRRAPVTGRGRLLDLACGTGEIAVPLAPSFAQADAVDQEPEMIAVGRARADVAHITWTAGRAEELHFPPDSMEMITIGNAFHRLDRPVVARLARTWLRPGGTIAILHGTSLWQGAEDWQRAAVEVIDKWRPARPAGPARSARTHQQVLADAGFAVEEHDFPVRHTWTPDAFVGYVYSTAFASRAVFGDALPAFEAELRSVLPGGRFEETIGFQYILARPDQSCQ
jgi:SAM-dependent methyltransferase